MGKKERNIPGLFKYLEKTGSHSIPLYPLEFRKGLENKERFILAGKWIPPSAFKTRRMNVNLQGVEKQRIEYRDMPKFPLLVSDRGLVVVGPRLTQFVDDLLPTNNKAKQTLGELGLACTRLQSGGFTLRRASGLASISPAESSNFIEPPHEKGFAEYTFMADEERSDRLVLLAGLGYLAAHASRS